MGIWKKSSSELKDLFKQTMDAFPEAEQKKMFGYPCCFHAGNMFTGLHEENWVVRLSPEDRASLSEKYHASAFEPMAGRVMKEYLILPKEVTSDPALLKEWVGKSVAFVKTLPAK